MLKRISKSFYSMSTGWAALTGLAVFVFFMIVVLPQQAQKAEAYSGGTSPDTSYIYSAGDLYQMAEDYGAEGRAAYIYARFTFDLVFPLVYGFFLTATISWLLARGLVETSGWRLLNLFPLAGRSSTTWKIFPLRSCWDATHPTRLWWMFWLRCLRRSNGSL
ncbi:MAG: hypothetical protein IPG44_06250 [Anaerolineales bacterium]|nr:hypothetical protein [Anaerolineales bacterium]